MARVVPNKTSLATAGTVNWDELLNGQVWELIQGEDFTSTIASFRAAFYTTAHKRGLVPLSRIVDKNKGVIHVQALPENNLPVLSRRRKRKTQITQQQQLPQEPVQIKPKRKTPQNVG